MGQGPERALDVATRSEFIADRMLVFDLFFIPHFSRRFFSSMRLF